MTRPPGLIREVAHKGFFHVLSTNLLSQGLSFLMLLVVAKVLDTSEFGDIRILQSYAALFTVLAGCGLSTALVRFASRTGDEAGRGALLVATVRRAAASTGVILVVVVALSLSGVLSPSPRLSRWMLVFALVIPFTVLTELFTVFMQAGKRMVPLSRSLALARILMFPLVVGATLAAGLAGFVLGTVLATAVGALLLGRTAGVRARSAPFTPLPTGFRAIALVSLLGNGVNVLGQYSDLYILDRFASDRHEIGLYALATIFILGGRQVTAAVQAVSTPYFSERAHDEVWFRRNLVRTQIRTAALSVGMAGVMLAGAAVLVPAVYGAEQARAVHYLAILSIRYVAWSSCAVIGVAILGLGLVRYNLLVSSIATPASLILSYLFLLRWGMVGVAWAQAITGVLVLVGSLLVVRLALRRAFGTRP